MGSVRLFDFSRSFDPLVSNLTKYRRFGKQALESGKRKCPSCAEMVKFEARICKHCGSDLEPYVAEVEPDAPTAAEKAIIKIFVISVLIVLALIWLPELLLT